MTNDEKKKRENDIYTKEDEYSKSNYLISSMYQSTLFENKIMAISFSRVQVDIENKKIYSKIKAGEIKRLLNDKAGTFYSKLDKAANHMTGKSIGMSNPITQEFDYIAIITRATYRDGELVIYYNYDLLDYIYNIKNNYTILQLSLTLSFKNNYAYRLYELLKSRAYYGKNKPHEEESIFKITYSLSELYFNLGLANIDDDNVKKILKNRRCPDFEKAIEVAQEKRFVRWCDFKLYVLEPALKEINEITDLEVEYEKVGKGKGGKIHDVIFYVKKYKSKNNSRKLIEDKVTQEQKETIIEEIMYMNMKERMKLKDARAIAEAAEWDMEKIQKAFDLLSVTKEIENVTGFLISAIKNNYQKNVQTTGKEKINTFNKFQQLSYDTTDFENIEKLLVLNL